MIFFHDFDILFIAVKVQLLGVPVEVVHLDAGLVEEHVLELWLEVLDFHLDLRWSHGFQLLDLIDGQLLDLLLKSNGLLLGHGDFLWLEKLSFGETFPSVDGCLRH